MNSECEVMTACGPVSGAGASGIRRYLGIPYAAAPIGDLRFAAPAPPYPWKEPLACTSFGPTAGQVPYVRGAAFPDAREPVIAGDAYLNLNVWTPDRGIDLPVLVWIHGGGFFGGCSANPWYDGTSFARHGLVFVSFNYRLGVEGFLEVPGATPNRALRDWLTALEWVQQNIAAFGGDPKRVTVMGQSAGGVAVTALLSTPRSAGLFSRAIICSGVFQRNVQTQAQADETATLIAQHVGIDASAQAFAGFTPAQLLAAQVDLDADADATYGLDAKTAAEGLRTILRWSPVVDRELITTTFLEAAARGTALDVPLLVGVTANEFNWVVLRAREVLDADAMKAAQSLTDAMFRTPAALFMDLRKSTAPTYRYEFQWRSRAYPELVGAGHSLDIPFFFNTLNAPNVVPYAGDHPPQRLADEMHGAFAQFARTGAPGWPACESGRAGYLKVF